ncbi:T9SS type A sorting domain-containing protein [bacterium]|nr:T9SS type A sorting domain-containing protein [bacterium]
MKYIIHFIFSPILILQICAAAFAQDSLNIIMLGEVHDFVEEAYDVTLSGNYAYLSSGLNSGMRVLDLSNPAAPVEVGFAINTDPCPGVWSWMSDIIRVSGDRAYVLYFDGTWSFAHYRLYVYDTSDPCAPRQMGYISLPDNCTSLFVEGDDVYVTAFEDVGLSEVIVIDVSDPAQPIEIGSFATPGMAHEVVVSENRAYVADNDSLIIFNVTDPVSAIKLGSYAPQGGATFIHHVAAHGDTVIITDSNFGIRILNVSDASNIEEIGSFPHHQTDVQYSRMKAFDDRLHYLQARDTLVTMIILDVSNPETPVKIGSNDILGIRWFYGFDFCNECGCIAGGKEGLHIVEITAPDSISETTIYDPYDLTSGLAVSRNHAFVGTYMDNLVVYDVSNPSSPIEVTALKFPESPIKQISVHGNHLYVPGVKVNHDGGVSVLDISDPTNPTEIAYWSAPPGYSGIPFNVECYNNYAFVACALGGVEIYDVTQIDQPIPLDNWTLWDAITNQDFGVTNVKIAWPYLFAPDRAFGLYVLDVSDPSNIMEVASCPTPGEAMWADISSDHHYVYIADADKGLRIIDVSNPSAPVEVGFHDQILEMANHVAVWGDSVYVSDTGQIGLHVFDVSDPTAPVEVAYHKTPGALAHDVVVTNGLIYFLDHTHFEIFKMTEGPTSVEENHPAEFISNNRIHTICPNPFNSSTTIIFDLNKAGHVTLVVYNTLGQKMETLVDNDYLSGRHTCIFQADELSSGIYFLSLQANGVFDSRKLILMK